MSEDVMFNVLNGDGEIVAVLPRAEAVAKAKELSGGGNKAEIKVESTDGMVSMTFFEGRLDIYVTETRDKRSRRRDRDEGRDDSSELDGDEDMGDDDLGDDLIEI